MRRPDITAVPFTFCCAGWRIMQSIMYTPKTQGSPLCVLRVFIRRVQRRAAASSRQQPPSCNAACRLMEIDKESPMFQHYAHILANPINAAQNPNSAKKGKLFAMYVKLLLPH